MLCLVLFEIFEGFDEDMLNWTRGVVSVLVRHRKNENWRKGIQKCLFKLFVQTFGDE